MSRAIRWTAPVGERSEGSGIGRDRPPPLDLVLLAVAVAGVSTSAPLIAAAGLPSLTVAFWRNALAAGVLALVLAVRAASRGELRTVPPASLRLVLGSGVVLGLHFAFWIPSLSFTSVASSTALVASQPVWAALIARGTGHRIAPRAAIGIALALGGVLLVTGSDWQVSRRAFGGDVLAAVGGMLAAVYVTMGARARRHVGATVHAAGCAAGAGVTLLVLALATRAPLIGLGGRGWAYLVTLTVTAQLGGHALFSRVLRTTSPTTVSVAILFEVVGASILAWAWLGDRPPVAIVPAAALIIVGVAAVVTAGPVSPAGDV